MQHITDIPLKQLVPGIAGHYAHGENMSFGLVILEAGASIPVHQHPQEQITYILEGELRMQTGGNDCILTPGMISVIPANTPHGAQASVYTRLIDVFAPVREDYKS